MAHSSFSIKTSFPPRLQNLFDSPDNDFENSIEKFFVIVLYLIAKILDLSIGLIEQTTQSYLRLCGKDVEGATEDLQIMIPEDQTLGKVYELRPKG